MCVCMCVGCWNVRSLVEMDGGIKTATVRPKGRPVSVDKKINFLVYTRTETLLYGCSMY